MATGLKLVKPERKVVVFTGDGDCVGIGGNHFLHAARRNIDLTVIMLDNALLQRVMPRTEASWMP